VADESWFTMTVDQADRKNEQHTRYLMILVFVFLAVIFFTLGFFSYQNYETEHRTEVDAQLSAVARMEVAKLEQWKSDRMNDAGVFSHNPLFSSRVQHLFSDSNDTESRDEVMIWLEKEQVNSRYDRVYLLDTAGVLWMSVPDTQKTVATSVLEQVSATLQSEKVTFIDFYRDDHNQKIYLAVLVPVFDDEGDGRPLGVLAFQNDPGQDLYPFINDWPAPGVSAETQLIRREGNDVVYLNGLSFNPDSALTLRVPLDRTEVPAVKAVLGQEGIVDGVDYHGQLVIADIQKVTGTPWFLITRMDASEVYGPLRERSILLIVIIAILLVCTGAGIGLIWRDRNIRFHNEMFEAENAVLKEHIRAKSYLDIVGTIVITINRDQIVTMVNRAGCRLLGRREEDIIGKNWFDTFVPERGREDARKSFERIIGGSPDRSDLMENFIVTADGEERLIAWHITLIRDDSQAITGTLRSGEDITERKRAEEMLKQSEEKYRHLIEHSDEAIVVAQDGMLRLVNNRAVGLTGYPEHELLSRSFLVFIHPDDRSMVMERYQKRLKGEKSLSRYTFRLSQKNGSIRWVEISVAAIDWEGRPATLNFLTDITERKQAEETLQHLTKFLESVISNARVWLSVLDQKGTILLWNTAAEEISGYRSYEVIGNKEIWKKIYPERDYRRQIADTITRIIRDKNYLENFETKIVTKQGTDKVISWNTRGIPDATGNVSDYIAIGVDITDRKWAEEGLHQANKKLNLLSSITRHDITNQLTVLTGYLRILEKKQPDTSFSEHFKKINTSAQQISTMIRFTKEYEAIGVNSPAWQDTRTLVDTAAKEAMLKKIMVKNDLPAGAEVYADPLVVKVFYNLMDNAVRYGGKITTIRFSAEERTGDHLIVCEDDGVGVVAEEKEKIFERGFGKNTGLGLALSHEILSITGITIRETGEPGTGARFEMTVPKRMWRTAGKDA
jgi:PAS domain S-box-containing protein